MIPLDAVLVISLPHRQDRRDRLMPQLERVMSRGVIPRLPVELVNRFPQGKTLVPSWWNNTDGYYGATREHQEVLQDLHQRGSRLALILEDDANIHQEFDSGIGPFYDEAMRYGHGWAALFLGGSDMRPRERVTDMLYRQAGCLGSHAYIVNPEGIRLMHDKLCYGRAVVDWAYLDLAAKHGRFFSPPRNLIGTQGGWSDNTKSVAKAYR